MKIFRAIGFAFLVLITISFSKDKIKSPEVTVNELKMHVSYLASDELKGRKTGTEGDSLAAEYIRKELKEDGLVPLYDKGFQRFRVTDKIIYGPANSLEVNAALLKVDTDFTPFAFSENNSFSAEVVFAGYGFDINEDSLKWKDYAGIDVKGKVVLILRADPEVEKNMSPFIKYSRDRDKVLQAKDRGASAVLLVSGKVFDPEDKFEPLAKGEQSVGIPALRISRETANAILEPKKLLIEDLEKKLNESRQPESFTIGSRVSGHSDVVETTIPTCNVVMEIPGTDPVLKNEFVVIGAHFDHLGMGGFGSGTRVPDTVAVHYGADDNASGAGMMLELAEKLAASPESHKRSIIVIGFTGEEMGLLGSKQFVENPDIDLNKVNAMVNLDMVGRLNENSLVQIGGVGTADPFRKIIGSSCDTTVLKLTLSEEGYGPSDHSSFYGKNIPVLFVSTGAHLDYHTPADTWDKINYAGMLKISDMAFRIISDLANMDNKLIFKEAGPKMVVSRGTRRKGVSLGIMPDFAGNVKNGLRADLVTPGRPAALGGMKKGDIIISINGKPVGNIQDYMFRLNQLKHGETINVEVLRDSKKEVLIIQL
ncbi:MAG: M20/M25/M40 family metallo-hydrolase [Bacteroidota bacterium]|nr:M20/M25/M40 family metallo-hydrolase [Bacteroidota bacterium]